MTSLPAPLFEPNRITTLIAPVDNELAALVAALAVLNDARTALAPSLMLGAIRAFYSAGAQHPHLQGGPSAIGRSTCSTRSKQRQSCPRCVP